MVAEYIGKYKDKFSDSVHLFYKYRGYEYMICDTHNYSMEMNSLKIQHEYEQERIDKIIADRKKQGNCSTKSFDIDEIYELLGWD